jgi:hypothetical protein
MSSSRLNHKQQTLQCARMSGQRAAEQDQIQEKKDCIKQCLAICTHASKQVDQFQTNIFEDVSTAQDAHQVVISTLGDLVSARHITAGVRSTQWLGQMSDATLQQLSRDRGRASIEKVLEPQNRMTGGY